MNEISPSSPAHKLIPLRISLLYAAFASVWIVASGKLLAITVDDIVLQAQIEMAKGLGFVAVTSLLLYWLLRRWLKTIVDTVTIQTENDLCTNESRFKAIIDASPVPMALNDEHGNITYLNRAFLQIIGYTSDDIPTVADWWQLAYPDPQYRQLVAEKWQNNMAEAIQNHMPFVPMEVNITCKDGTVRICMVGSAALKDNFAGTYVVTLYDITQRKQAENALKISEEQFRSLFTQAPLGIALIDSHTGQIYKANQKFADIVGLSLDELQRIDWMQITHPDDVQADLDNMALMNAGKTNGFVMEKRYIHADGSIVWINLTVAKILLKEQTTPCHHCMVEDITERKKITDALNASAKEFRLLAESMPQIVWITRADGWNIYFNQQWMDYTGLSLEESYGHGWNKPFHPDDQQRAWDAWQDAVNNNGTYSLECQLLGADGLYRWWLIRGVPLFDEAGNIYKWFGTCTDIHELKESEKSLRIAAIAFESQDAMIVTDAKQTILKVNQAFTQMTGYSAEDAIGNTPSLLKSGIHDKQFYDTLWETLNRDEFWTGEIWNRRKNGELYPEWLNISAVADANGKVSNYIAAFTDITLRKKQEEAIHHLAYYDPLTHLPNRRV